MGITDMMLSSPTPLPDQNSSDDDSEEKYIVISVVDDIDPTRVLGFVAGEDVHSSLFSSSGS